MATVKLMRLSSNLRQKKTGSLADFKVVRMHIHILFHLVPGNVLGVGLLLYYIAFYVAWLNMYAPTLFLLLFLFQKLSRSNDTKIIHARISGGPFLIGKQKLKGPHDHESCNPWIHSFQSSLSLSLSLPAPLFLSTSTL